MRLQTDAAIRAAGIAQRIADSRAGADQIKSKGGIDLVTATDVACEDAIRSELTRAFPDYPVIGEERGGTPSDGKPYWLVDPICGTRPFASNVPLYCSNIALVENGSVTVAAIGVGRTGEIVYAERDSGAWIRTALSEQRIGVADSSNTIWIDGKTEHAANVVRRAIVLNSWYVWLFSSTLSYVYAASGRISGILHFGKEKPIGHGSVHTAAGCFVAREAGAIVTDVDTGQPWRLSSRSHLVAASSSLHDQLLDLAHGSIVDRD